MGRSALRALEARRWLRAGAAELAPRVELAHALATLRAYEPADAAQLAVRARMLEFCGARPDALWRTCRDGHLTASALVLDARGERVLLTLHRKLGRWLQLGGHVDGDANLAAAALREGLEESGLAELAIDPRPIDLDMHRIPARAEEPEHWHLDTRFLIWSRDTRAEVCSSESFALRWFTRDELATIDTDVSVRRLFDIVFG